MGRQGLVYVGPVHGRHVIVRLVQRLGSFVYLEKEREREGGWSPATELLCGRALIPGGISDCSSLLLSRQDLELEICGYEFLA